MSHRARSHILFVVNKSVKTIPSRKNFISPILFFKMSLYLHCNQCGAKLKSNQPLNLLSCKHVLCLSCSGTGDQGCKLCRKPAKAILIRENMPESMRFISMNPVLKFKEAQNAEVFQVSQQLSYLGFFEPLKEKYKQIMVKNANYDKNIEEKQEAVKKELIVIKKIRALIDKKTNFPDQDCSTSPLNLSHSSSHSTVSTPSFLSLASDSPASKSEQPASNTKQNKVSDNRVSSQVQANSEGARNLSERPKVRGKV